MEHLLLSEGHKAVLVDLKVVLCMSFRRVLDLAELDNLGHLSLKFPLFVQIFLNLPIGPDHNHQFQAKQQTINREDHITHVLEIKV